MAVTEAATHAELEARLRRDVEPMYRELTDDLRRSPRLAELVYAAAERFPGLLPTRAEIDAERELLQKDKRGLEIAQGIFAAHVLGHPRIGPHLVHAMSQPRAEALAALEEFRGTGSLGLGPVRVDRERRVGHVTIQHHAFLNSEDDATAAALETAVDLVLLDDGIDVGVLRGAPATHPKYAGRRILGSGLNLTRLYHGKISLVEFMIERELGAVAKLQRGHALGDFADEEREDRREKPWIVAVETFAIGGACQWLLVADCVLAEQGSYVNLPARREGIVPGCANMRLPRFVGERLARQMIFFNRTLEADAPEALLLADQVVARGAMGAAIEHAAAELMSAGTTSMLANRRRLRSVQEPLERFRRYMSGYARDQAYCLYSPALIDNLERNWTARRRR